MIFNTNIGSGSPDDYDALVAFLRDRYDDDLRWVASYNADSYKYKVQYIREDLKTELTNAKLDTMIHRTIALFDRPYVEEVYTHLGHAQSLVLHHEKATAVHIYLGDSDGLVIKIKAGNSITVPDFVEECLAVLRGEAGEE
jgi:hypothetical protein